MKAVVIVVNPKDNPEAEVPAELMVCDAEVDDGQSCYGQSFQIFVVQIDGVGYNHLQCTNCGTTYCQHEGPCRLH